MLKRRIVRVCLLLAVIALLVLAELHPPGANRPPDWGRSPDHVVLSWTASPATTVTISWRTNPQITQSLVQFHPRSFPGQIRTARGKATLLSTNLGDFRMHTATLTGLRPGTTYAYRVGDGRNWSRQYSFTTAAADPERFTVVVFGDSQSGLENYRVWRHTLQTAVGRERPQFIINTGDLVDRGNDQRHWEAWFAAGRDILEQIPELPVVGNHDLGGSRRPSLFLSQFALPENGPPGLKEQAYSFNYGNAHFTVLDSQTGDSPELLRREQAWLQEDLQGTGKPWRIVLFHRPPYYAKPGRPNNDVKEVFCPVVERYRVNLVISGHDHGVLRTYPLSGDRKTTVSRGTVFLIAGRSGEKTYSDLKRYWWAQFFYNPTDQPTYLVLRFQPGRLQVISKKVDGTILDQTTLNAPSARHW